MNQHSCLKLIRSELNDSFFFTAKNISLANKITKRLVLSTIAKVFDPLGFLAPFVVKGKVLMQEIWRGGYDWDTELSFELQKRFMDWISDLQFITSMKVPRHVGFHSQASETQLHLFSDASKDAYGCVAYLFVRFNDEWKSTLVASKSRVSPLTVVTIPRLELLGAVLAAELALRLLKVFDCSHLNVRFWTDSEIVRNWLRNSASKLKPFVANRMEFILQNFSPQQWSHIPGSLNPADVVSRGESLEKLEKNDLWWTGPMQFVVDNHKKEEKNDTDTVLEDKCYYKSPDDRYE